MSRDVQGYRMECPMNRKTVSQPTSECPVSHGQDALLNPENKMPYAEILQRPTDPMAESLPTTREASTIPRADTNTTWQYPSPRMFYTALHRKGKPVPAESIDSMLDVHNALNEAVWEELVSNERILAPSCPPKLIRFMGRPDELSPRAWWHVKVRGGEAPFDRHDWVIDRCGCEVRYVIDYYAGHPEPGQATFNVDLRPALDSPQACLDRMRLFWRKHFIEKNPRYLDPTN